MTPDRACALPRRPNRWRDGRGGACRGRRALRLLLLAQAGVLLSQGAIAADPPAEFPRRKPGLWEVRAVAAQASGLPPTQHCIGDRSDNETSQLDRSVGNRGACSLGGFRRAGDAWLAESVCREGKSSAVSRAIATGDFEQQYRIDTLVTYDPPLGGVRREDREAVVARYLGPCASSQKPGDMVVPGMGTHNMIDGTFRAEPPPPPQPRKRRSN